jgi:hypothetical protein
MLKKGFSYSKYVTREGNEMIEKDKLYAEYIENCIDEKIREKHVGEDRIGCPEMENEANLRKGGGY